MSSGYYAFDLRTQNNKSLSMTAADITFFVANCHQQPMMSKATCTPMKTYE